MRVLTVRQPFAWAIIHGGKDVENRPRNIAGEYRGPVAVHAGRAGASFDAKHPDLWPFDSRHTLGAIIGVVDLVGVHTSRDRECARLLGIHETGEQDWAAGCSPWAEHDRTHLVLANPRPLSDPIPFRGTLGLRTLPAEVEADVLQRLEAA